jgi:prepilin-type N-terminal cleavage/methylation domain-containing protein
MSAVAALRSGSPSRGGARAARGFTLIELVLMLSILGILAMLAVPEQNLFHEVKLRSAARRLVSDLRYAQSRTMASRVVHHVNFDPVGERYTVTAPDRTTPVADPADRGRALGMDYAQDGEFRGVSIASVSFGGRPEVSFDTMGVPRTAAGTELTTPGRVVLAYEGLIVTVEVAPGTGKAKLR